MCVCVCVCPNQLSYLKSFSVKFPWDTHIVLLSSGAKCMLMFCLKRYLFGVSAVYAFQ